MRCKGKREVGKGKREEERGMIAAKNAKVAKADWKMVKLGEVAEFLNGKSKPIGSGIIPVYGSNGIISYSNRFLYSNAIIVGRVGAYAGSIARCRTEFWPTDNTIVVKPKEGMVDTDFIFYRMQKLSLSSLLGGSAQPLITQGILKSKEFPLPPLPTQRKIAAVLGALDDKIENNRKICANLEAQAQALFKSWFVDFEPFGGSGFKNSEIGKIPVGWSVFKLGDFLPIKTGKKDANVADTQGKYPFFSCSQNVLWTDDYSFDGRAILVAGNGDFNVKRCDGKFEAYQRTYVLMPYKEFLAGWLYYVVKYNLEKITMSAQGSVIKFITKGHLEDFKFAAPSIVEEKENEDTRIFNEINSVIDSRIEENYRLAELRDALLPKLMSGELDVDDVEV